MFLRLEIRNETRWTEVENNRQARTISIMNINVSSSTNDFTTALFDLRPVWHVKGRSIIRARDTNVIRCITRRHLYRNHRNRIVQSPFHVFPHVDHPHLVSNFISLSRISFVRYIYDIIAILEILFLFFNIFIK